MSNKVLIAQNGIKITPTIAYPTTPSNGMIVYRSDLGGFYVYEAGSWVKLGSNAASGGTSLNVLPDPSFEQGVDGWFLDTGTGSVTNVAADLLTATNKKMLALQFTGSSVAFDTTAKASFPITADMLNKNLVFKGWYKCTTNNVDLLINYGAGDDNFEIPAYQPGGNIWKYFEFPFRATTTLLQFTVRNNANLTGNFTVLFDQLYLGLSEDKQAPNRYAGAAAIDFNYQTINLSVAANLTFTYANPKAGRVVSLLVKNVGGSLITMTFPTSVKSPSMPLTIAAGTTTVFTIICTFNVSTLAYQYHIAAVTGMV